MAVTVTLSNKAFVTKEEVREALFAASSEVDRTENELNVLYRMINDVCEGIESFVTSPIIQRSCTEYDDGGGEYVFLTTLPAISVTTVKELGISLTGGVDYVFDESTASVRRLYTDVYTASTFSSGTKAVEIVYLAGYGTQTRDPGTNELTSVTNVPDDFKLAAQIWIDHLWAKGPANYSPEQGQSTGTRASIPYEVKEILRNRVLQVHWIGM